MEICIFFIRKTIRINLSGFIALVLYAGLHAQDFVQFPLITLPGRNTNYDYVGDPYFKAPGGKAFIVFENYYASYYSIVLKKLPPDDPEYVLVYSDTLPQVNPSISFLTPEPGVRIIWQSKIDQTWQLLSRTCYPDSLGPVVQLTAHPEDNLSPSLFHSYLCWIQGSELMFGTLTDSLHIVAVIDSNSANPDMIHETAYNWFFSIDMVYEKAFHSNTLIKHARYDERNSTFETSVISDSSVNLNPVFGYFGDISYQRFVNGFWKCVISDPYGYSDEWITEDRLFNTENPYFFSYPIPTQSENNAIRDYFLVYESDSVTGNREIILEFEPGWSKKPTINVSNLPGDDTHPVTTVMKDSVVVFWEHTVDTNNTQIWWAKAEFDPYSHITEDNGNPVLQYTLCQNYPNPFNPSTTIAFTVPTSGFVSLDVYDITGRHIAALIKEELSAGTHRVPWYAQNFPSGIYFYKLETKGYRNVKKLIRLK